MEILEKRWAMPLAAVGLAASAVVGLVNPSDLIGETAQKILIGGICTGGALATIALTSDLKKKGWSDAAVLTGHMMITTAVIILMVDVCGTFPLLAKANFPRQK